VDAAGIQEEKAPRVLARVEQAFGARIDKDAAAGIAAADEVRMRVPDLRGIDPLPRVLDQLFIVGVARQSRVAGIPEALLGPIAPRGKRSRPRQGRARA
jgi:hypothetical protein